ncbi:CAP domain-containing protein [Streptomyces sp. C10-9-1]|uniref:CAP domain-containing protein n=1 Tax=Streptomyces sp. C10-9-1 TaxID=1859285 RepID=UPI003F4A4B8F
MVDRAALPDVTDEDPLFNQEALSRVNFYRAQHLNTPNVVLDQDLIDQAKKRAQEFSAYSGLNENHRGQPEGLGERVFWSVAKGPMPVTATEAIDAWYKQIDEYLSDSGKETGDFSQLVWVNSKAIGFARVAAEGPEGVETYIVGLFAPAGNVEGGFAANVQPRQ